MARKTTRTENPFLYEQKENETLEHWYKRLAKQADQRLVRLEKLTKQEGFENVNKYAYARAMRDIKQWSGECSKRFNVQTPKNKNQLKAKIRDIQTFLESPTSTKKGVESVYQSKADSINEKYGTKFSWRDLANYFEQGKSEHIDMIYGSKTVLRAVGVIQQNADIVKKQIEQHKQKHIVVDDPILQTTIDKILTDRKIKINEFF